MENSRKEGTEMNTRRSGPVLSAWMALVMGLGLSGTAEAARKYHLAPTAKGDGSGRVQR